MKKKDGKAGRREFLKGSIQALIATPLAGASMPSLFSEEGKLLEEGGELLPGDSGYRDPETSGLHLPDDSFDE